MKVNTAVVCLLFAAPVFADVALERAEHSFQHHCYLEARDHLRAEIDQNPTNKKAIRALRKLNRIVDEALLSADSGIQETERDYLLGFSYYRDGAKQLAENVWLKFLEKRKREPVGEDDQQVREVEAYYKRIKKPFRVPPTVATASLPVDKIPVLPAPPAVRRPKKPRVKITPAFSPDQLIAQAEKAQLNGQLDYAYRLAKMAALSQPNSPPIKSKLAELEKLMQ